MAKKYMGEGDPVLDALYEELDATGRKTRTDRRKRRQLEREIRKIRAGRLGGIRGLFRGLVDDLGQGFLMQHISKPQLDQFADETQANIAAEAAGEEKPFPTPAQDVLGRNFRFRVPPTAAEVVPEVVPEIEEIEVTAEKRPEIVESEPRRGDLTRRSQFPFGVYTGEYAEQFGNDPVQEMLSKLGPNQLKTLERRKMKMAQWPDAFPADYATPEGIYKYAQGGTLTGQADMLARAGRGDDTMLMHVTPDEVAGLASLAPGMMTINPETGLPEAGWFRNLLGTAAPFLMSMIPGVGPVLAGAMGGGIGSLIKGGDWKDALFGAGLGALGGKMFGGASEAGADVLAGEAATEALASPEGFADLVGSTGYDMSAIGDVATSSGIDPTLFQGAINQGMSPNAYLSTVANPTQIGTFQQGLTDVARSSMPAPSFAQNFKNIGAGGLSGLKDAAFTPAGLSYITGTGLKLQHEGQEGYEDFLLAKEEADRQRERDIAAYYSENLPYLAREGGSIYKNRYINGNWS